jgi:predicted component of type VI protein secretion system
MPAALRGRRAVVSRALRDLLRRPHRYDLGAALDLLARALDSDDPLAAGDFDRAPVRLRTWRGKAPTVVEVGEVRRAGAGSFDVTTGLFGLSAVRPDDDTADRLAHRLGAAWYAAWRAAVPWGSDLGRAVAEVADPGPVPAFAALFARPHSAAGLAWYLARRFNLVVHVISAAGDWTTAPRRTYDPAFACRLVLGPVDADRFRRLLPGGRELSALLRAARGYAGPEVRFVVTVRLEPGAGLVGRLDESALNCDMIVAGAAGLPAAELDFAACRAEEERPRTS